MALEKSNFVGTLKTYWAIGKASIIKIVNNSGIVEIRDSAGTAYAKLRALRIQTSPNIDDVPTLLDSQAKVIQFSFDGASAPAAGTNTGKFGFCHTTGGSYTNNDVVYDDGVSLIKLPRESCKLIVTTDAVSGTVSLNADGIYGWEGSAYVLKGDGAQTDTGFLKSIKVDYDFEDSTVSSTTTIPVGAVITKVINMVNTIFNNGAPTLLVQLDGTNDTTIMDTDESDLLTAAHYHKDELFSVASDYNGVIKLTVTPDGSSAGAGSVIVYYTTPSA